MLTLQDCIGLVGLTPDQVEAIADHEHLEMIIATEWAGCMLDKPNGDFIVEGVLADAVDHCRHCGDARRGERYQDGLDAFIRQH